MRDTKISESRTLMGRFRGGKLNPVLCVGFRGGEGGMLSQTATIELDPVVGRLVTPVTAEMIAVYVPVQAMAALDNPDDPSAGITEVIRQSFLDGHPMFSFIPENEITRRLGVMPASVGGVRQVNSAPLTAHNCAVNFLRKRKYVYAKQLLATNKAVTPALLSTTAMEMFNGVLNPDDHINGFVALDLAGKAPVRGIWRTEGASADPVERNGLINFGLPRVTVSNDLAPANRLNFDVPAAGQAGNTIYSELGDAVGTGFSLTDIYNAETMDRLTRKMRSLIDANPIDGEEQIVRWAHGLSVDTGQNPWLVHYSQKVFGQSVMRAMDGEGIEAETTQSRLLLQMGFNVPIPTTELGGVVVTFMTVKPDETIYQQPHPLFSRPWGLENHMAEELMNDPMPVTAREVSAGVAAADEMNVVFYTGFNELRRYLDRQNAD